MAGHVLSVCVFCLICATHSPCASHASLTAESPRLQNISGPDLPLTKNATRERFKDLDSANGAPQEQAKRTISRRDINSFLNSNNNKSAAAAARNVQDRDFYVKQLFAMYARGDSVSLEGFQALMEHVFHLQENMQKLQDFGDEDPPAQLRNQSCQIKDELKSLDIVDNRTLDLVCPAILYSLLSGGCAEIASPQVQMNSAINSASWSVWLYSIGAVILISACGVLSLVIIPVMQKKFYKPLLQFLVALAVGTLAGDALLHLLPHAMSSSGPMHHHHDAHGGHNEENHENMWKGFVAMLGLILFFIMERFIPLIYRWRKSKRSKGFPRVKVLQSEMEIAKAVATQCVDKYNAYDRCYKDILDDPSTTFLKTDDRQENRKDRPHLKLNNLSIDKNAVLFKLTDKEHDHENQTLGRNFESNQNSAQYPCSVTKPICKDTINSTTTTILPQAIEESDLLNRTADDSYTVILSEHGAAHHGHSHIHGHVHAAPKNFSSVAWMVIMGDGLHNFTDGIAIGASFAGSLAGGFSTAVAVFCHELPHELGDFAMLLKAGMSIRQALFYNILSSVLCILGNFVGVWLGNLETASSWVFAVAAGTFIYIALVDMIPELSSAHDDEGNFVQTILHLSGLLMGFGIMTLIALYEHDLKSIFKD